MRIFNATKKRTICDGCDEVNPCIGLLFQRPHPVIFSFRLPRRISLHNMFVFGTTDVLFLKESRIVDIKRGFRPFTFYTSRRDATHVVELPAGLDTMTAVGDVIRF